MWYDVTGGVNGGNGQYQMGIHDGASFGDCVISVGV